METKTSHQKQKPVISAGTVRRLNLTPEQKAYNQKMRARWYLMALALKAKEPRVHF